MNLQLIVLFYIILIIGAIAELPRIQSFSYQVLLKFNNTPFCGGSIITERHILTAAHCLAGKSKDFPKIGIYGGTSYSNEKADPIYRIYRVDINPKYTGRMTKSFVYLNDIAVITLKESIIFSKTRNKIKLTSEDIRIGSTAVLSGWRITTYSKKGFSTDLLSNEFSIINNIKCGAILSNKIFNDQICTFSKVLIKKCPGDSGGPLVSDGELIGVASNTIMCQKDVPDVYTSVYHSLGFIRTVIRNKYTL